tara:strand:- start:1639 stop:1752 length:114 start_codon:yes stop_codon:yes gene_type:complete
MIIPAPPLGIPKKMAWVLAGKHIKKIPFLFFESKYEE